MKADIYSEEIIAQSEWFERNMKRVARTMRNRINAMLNKLDSAGGSFEYTTGNVSYQTQLYFGLMEELRNAGYYELVGELERKENDLLKLMKANRPKGAIPLAFTTTTQAKLTAINSLYRLEFGGVAEAAMQKITGIVLDTIVRTGKISTCIQQIEAVLEKNLVRYAATYCNTTRAHFIQAVEYANAEEYEGERYWQYLGPYDDLNRPACQDGLAIEFFTDAERDQFEAETADERMYNCRHTFIQITKEFYLENKA